MDDEELGANIGYAWETNATGLVDSCFCGREKETRNQSLLQCNAQKLNSVTLT